MKSIKQQYIDLKENKMTSAQFMRNVRMTLPHLVSSTNSLKDTVKILTNKGILLEIKEKKQIDYSPSHPHEVELGIEDEGGADDFDMYDKLKSKVLKNLEKDPNYYTHKKTGKKQLTKAKRDKLNYVEIKKNFKSENQLEKAKIQETKLRKAVRNVLLQELSSDTFKSYAGKSQSRGQYNRTAKGSNSFFHQFIGKTFDGDDGQSIIYNIEYEADENMVMITIKEQDNDKKYIQYYGESDKFDMKYYSISRKDARLLSLIAKKINPETKYINGTGDFKITGY